MQAHIDVNEPAPPTDEDAPWPSPWKAMTGRRRRRLISRYWAPGWNSVQALNKFQSEIGGPLRGGDPGRRLIEPAPAEPGRSFTMPRPPARLADDE